MRSQTPEARQVEAGLIFVPDGHGLYTIIRVQENGAILCNSCGVVGCDA